MKHLANLCAILFLLACWSTAHGQGTPFEDAASPKVSDPLSQDPNGTGSRGQPGYGSVMPAIQPITPMVGVANEWALNPATHTQTAPTPASGLTRFAGQSLVKPASSWSAGSTAFIGNGVFSGGMNSASVPGSGVTAAPVPAPPLPTDRVTAESALLLLKQTANFVPGGHVSMNGSSGPVAVSGALGGRYPGGTAPMQQSNAGNNLPIPSSQVSDTGAPVSPLSDLSLYVSPSSERMTIRLIMTADGLQLVLQTKNNLTGSILGDQSAISRKNTGKAGGWWGWTAGDGSWEPINVFTTSPLERFDDPGEKLLNKLITTPKVGVESPNP